MFIALLFTLKDMRHDWSRTLLGMLGLGVVIFNYQILISMSGTFAEFLASPGVSRNLIVTQAEFVDPSDASLDPAALEAARSLEPGLVQRTSPVMFRPIRIDDRTVQLRSAPLEDWQSVFHLSLIEGRCSDWYTYHISNDIPDFTTDYLSGSPFRDRELYVKTAPISNIVNAKTPMLQHGLDDRRVPFSNAMELYRGLKEMGMPVKLFAFPGMGHPITKPRENYAVMNQNLAWFSHYLLGEELTLE